MLNLADFGGDVGGLVTFTVLSRLFHGSFGHIFVPGKLTLFESHPVVFGCQRQRQGPEKPGPTLGLEF